jgi:mono/diheme cytochrome c family protein
MLLNTLLKKMLAIAKAILGALNLSTPFMTWQKAQNEKLQTFQILNVYKGQRVFIMFFMLGAMVLINACSDTELVSMKRLNNGVKLYEKHCSNCHQADGSGLAQLIPPLKGSDYLAKHALDLPCMIKNGMSGSLQVNGVNYNQAMPANKILSAEDIADICVYVWQKFPTQPLLYPDSLVRTELKKCL